VNTVNVKNMAGYISQCFSCYPKTAGAPYNTYFKLNELRAPLPPVRQAFGSICSWKRRGKLEE